MAQVHLSRLNLTICSLFMLDSNIKLVTNMTELTVLCRARTKESERLGKHSERSQNILCSVEGNGKLAFGVIIARCRRVALSAVQKCNKLYRKLLAAQRPSGAYSQCLLLHPGYKCLIQVPDTSGNVRGLFWLVFDITCRRVVCYFPHMFPLPTTHYTIYFPHNLLSLVQFTNCRIMLA